MVIMNYKFNGVVSSSDSDFYQNCIENFLEIEKDS